MVSRTGRPAHRVRVLFVCWGNICRSPTAEAVLQGALDEREGWADVVEVDSAGVSDEHAGDPPDRRAVAAAAHRGLDLRGRARAVRPDDFQRFDLMLVSDALVERVLLGTAPESRRSRIHRMTDFVAGDDAPDEVPDPYYGGADGFAAVLDLLERTCAGLIEHLGTGVHGADVAPWR